MTIGFIDIFKKLFGTNWSDRLEHVLRYTTLALLDSPNTTVLSILKMLTDKNYRKKIISRIEDSVVKNFWVSEFASWSERFDEEAITPLLNKVGQLVSNNMILNIIGQPQTKFDIRDIINLGVREFYTKMSVNGEIREAFSGRTLEAPKVETDWTDQIIEHGHKNYCTPVSEVENLLKKWDEDGEFSEENSAPEVEQEFEAPLI